MRLDPAGNGDARVLIVDDDGDTRRAIRLLLEDEGIGVAGEAQDGIEALILVLKRRPSCVLLDHHMPRMDGEKTATILRAVAPDVRIIAFSSLFSHRPEWADAYLTKDRISDAPALLSALLVPEAAGHP